MKRILTLLITLPLSAAQIVPINPGRALGVCEVLQHLGEYRGKVVEIRGEWHGGYLTDACPILKTDDYTWPNAVLTVQPDDPIVRDYDPVNWRLDAKAYERTEAQLKRARRNGSVVTATFIGRLDARESLFLVTLGVPAPVPGGYGHLGAFPAQLVMMTVKDGVVSKGKLLPGYFTGDPF